MTTDNIGNYLAHAQTYLHMARAELQSNKPALLMLQEIDFKLEALIAEFAPSDYEPDEPDPEQESEKDELDSEDDIFDSEDDDFGFEEE
jgi:hypothetical protein